MAGLEEGYSPLAKIFFAPPLASKVSLRLGHARGKTTLSCFLTLSRRFATPMAYAQMRTPFCNILLQRWALVLSFYEIKINTIHEGWCSFLWRAKRNVIRTELRSFLLFRANNLYFFNNYSIMILPN